MGVEIEEQETDLELEVEEPEAQEEETEEVDEDNQEDISEDENDETESEEDDEDGEMVISIGDEEVSPAEEDDNSAPSWVKEVREANRNLAKENRELKKLVEQQAKSEEVKQVTLPPKPTLEAADYDEDVFQQNLDKWYEQKNDYDKAQSEIKQAEEKAQQEWNQVLTKYEEGKSKLKVRDYDEAESVITDTLSEQQQGIILNGADNANLVVYALGKNPQKAKELASINDPVKFAFAVAKLETDLKVTKRKPQTQPEKKITGTGKMSGASDPTLEKLRRHAEKTGDYSKVMEYRRKKRDK